MKIIFLGTGGSFPTKKRGLISIAIRRKGEVLLFDCGEGTQRQMTWTEISPMKIDAVFLTHFHGDHFLGLPGLIQTMSLMDRERELKIFGPLGTETKISSLLKIPCYNSNFEISIDELSPGDEINREEYEIKTVETNHSVSGLAYSIIEEERPGKFYPKKAERLGIKPGPDYSRLQEGESIELENGKKVNPNQVIGPSRPGRKITYSGDTRPSKKISKLAENSDVLIHEGTFSNELEEEAEKASHCTAKKAAEIAKEAKVEKLILVHPSPRYPNLSKLEKEAQKIFSNSIYAEDLMDIKVELKD
ncbi:ribonuclease Z [candidate division MSBL1 archaeon SCGC-AAA382A03]|uniref:Ribonuclease Z n=1 Tax=candidate division MSBL1 archaeon SCGC-AAA382A03 TaxID=1698278 RepID=A0A133VFP2_9EURY|nr:ribonuclease Z [candidate division MSBL1 archaeon SCGC-AAA382A03]